MNTIDVALNRLLTAQNTMNGGRQACTKVLIIYVAYFIIKLNKTLDRNV
jgi:hypothetical protein